jgi:hypothetical protein
MIAATLVAGTAFLANPGPAVGQAYQDERDACRHLPASERGSCLREAAAARAAARKGELATAGSYEANATQRCNALPAADRDACLRRARGEGVSSGSVEGGGILREYREITLPPAQQSSVVPTQQAPSDTASGTGSAVGLPQSTLPAQTLPSPAPSPQPAPAGVMIRR